MSRNKYKIVFYKFNNKKFYRVCTRTWYSTFKFAIKTALNQRAVFIIKKYSKIQ